MPTTQKAYLFLETNASASPTTWVEQFYPISASLRPLILRVLPNEVISEAVNEVINISRGCRNLHLVSRNGRQNQGGKSYSYEFVSNLCFQKVNLVASSL